MAGVRPDTDLRFRRGCARVVAWWIGGADACGLIRIDWGWRVSAGHRFSRSPRHRACSAKVSGGVDIRQECGVRPDTDLRFRRGCVWDVCGLCMGYVRVVTAPEGGFLGCFG